MCQNRTAFKQPIAGGAIDTYQINACTTGALNEVWAAMLMVKE